MSKEKSKACGCFFFFNIKPLEKSVDDQNLFERSVTVAFLGFHLKSWAKAEIMPAKIKFGFSQNEDILISGVFACYKDLSGNPVRSDFKREPIPLCFGNKKFLLTIFRGPERKGRKTWDSVSEGHLTKAETWVWKENRYQNVNQNPKTKALYAVETSEEEKDKRQNIDTKLFDVRYISEPTKGDVQHRIPSHPSKDCQLFAKIISCMKDSDKVKDLEAIETDRISWHLEGQPNSVPSTDDSEELNRLKKENGEFKQIINELAKTNTTLPEEDALLHINIKILNQKIEDLGTKFDAIMKANAELQVKLSDSNDVRRGLEYLNTINVLKNNELELRVEELQLKNEQLEDSIFKAKEYLSKV